MKQMPTMLLWLSLAFAAASPLFAGPPMGNDDVVKLVRAGMSEALILSSIDSCEPGFDTSADALIKLKKAGVSDTIIQRMLSKKPASSLPQAVGAQGSVCALAAPESLLPVMDGPRQVNLSFREADIDEDVSAGSTIANILTLGVAPEKGTVSARISGARASHRITSGSPVFLDLATIEGQSPGDVFALIRFDIKDGDRTVVIGEASASLFGGYKGRSKFKDGTEISLKLEKKQSNCRYKDQTINIYSGTPETPLRPGEYALIYGEILYDFGVGP